MLGLLVAYTWYKQHWLQKGKPYIISSETFTLFKHKLSNIASINIQTTEEPQNTQFLKHATILSYSFQLLSF